MGQWRALRRRTQMTAPLPAAKTNSATSQISPSQRNGSRLIITLASRLLNSASLKHHHQHPAIGLISAARGIPCVLNRVRGFEIVHHADAASALQRLADVITLAIHHGIDLVGDFPIALIFFESNVVRA